MLYLGPVCSRVSQGAWKTEDVAQVDVLDTTRVKGGLVDAAGNHCDEMWVV